MIQRMTSSEPSSYLSTITHKIEPKSKQQTQTHILRVTLPPPPTDPSTTMASLIKLLLNKEWEAADVCIQNSPQDLKIQYPMDAAMNATALEAAIQAGAPDGLILKVLETYPKQARIENSYTGYTPLFIACKYGASEKVVRPLILAYPEVLLQKRRWYLKKGAPRKIVKWSSWSYAHEHKKTVQDFVNKTPEDWKARSARTSILSSGTKFSQASRGFADALGPVDNGEFDVDTSEEQKDDEEEEEEEEEQEPPTVPEVLEELQIAYLDEKFKEQVILTFDDLKDLSIEDLKEMELKIGERNRLKKYINKANTPKADPSTDPELAAIKHYATLFKSIDGDGKGSIDLAEFTGALKALGKYRNEFETKIVFEQADTDGSGEIDLDEFIGLMKMAQKAEGDRAAILKDLAENRSHDEASNLGRIAAACRKLNIRMVDVFETPESDIAMASAFKALSRVEPGSADRCRDPSIHDTVDFLILDTAFTLKAAEAACKLEVGRQMKVLNIKATSMKDKIRVTESEIPMDDVVQNAVELYREACYAYSSLPENRKPQDRSFNQLEQTDLNEFRLCALQAACSKAVADFPPIAAESQRLLVANVSQMAVQYGPQIFAAAMKALG